MTMRRLSLLLITLLALPLVGCQEHSPFKRHLATIVLSKLFLNVGEPCLTALETRQRELEWVRAARRDGFCLRFLGPVWCQNRIVEKRKKFRQLQNVPATLRRAWKGVTGTVSGTKPEEGTPTLPLPLPCLAAWPAVWLGRVLQQQIDYLKEENRALEEQLCGRKLRLTDATRRRLAVLGKELGRKVRSLA